MRYTREIRLRYRGDLQRCQAFIPRARTVLGEVWNRDIELGQLLQTIRRVRIAPDAVVTVAASRFDTPIVLIDVSPDARERAISVPQLEARLVWIPEGIVLTPVTEANPDGWGLPRREYLTGLKLLDELGTEGGTSPQVLLNRFENNKYLDRSEFIEAPAAGDLDLGENQRIASIPNGLGIGPSPQYQYWHQLYTPYDCDENEVDGEPYWDTDATDRPGLYFAGTLIHPQFEYAQGPALITELESNEWHTHRPEEVLYPLVGYEEVYQQTNSIRVSLGREPLLRPLRGRGNTAAAAVREVARSGLQYHDNEAFRPGYRRLTSRIVSGRWAVTGAENLQITGFSPDTPGAGELVVQVWEESPPHYANIISSTWEIEGFTTELHVAAGEATVTETVFQGTLDSPVSGFEWAQVFIASTAWLPTPAQYHAGEHHTIGNYGKLSAYERWGYLDDLAFFFVSWGQVLLAVPQDLLPDPAFAVLGAAAYEHTYPSGEKRTFLRCAIACGEEDREDYDDFTLAVITTELASTGVTSLDEADVTGYCRWELESSIDFLMDDDWIAGPPGQVKFSPNGLKFVFTMHQISTRYTDKYLGDFSTPSALHSAPGYMNDFVDVDYFRFEYEAGTGFVSTQIDMPEVVIAGAYSRSVDGSFAALFDYDDDSQLIEVRCVIEETQNVTPEGGPASMQTVRTLVFPSGKEIEYHREAFDGIDGGVEFLCFYYLDVKTEDCVFIRRKATAKDHYVANGGGFALGLIFEGEYTIEADLGSGAEREQHVLYDEGVGLAGYTNSVEVALIRNGNVNAWADPARTYNVGWSPTVIGSFPFPSAIPLLLSVPVTASAGSSNTNSDHLNTILMENHKCKFLMGIRPGLAGDESIGGFWGTPAITDRDVTLRHANVAPLLVTDDSAGCQLVRYRDRVLLRINHHTRLPWRNLQVTMGEHEGEPAVLSVGFNWTQIPEEVDPLVWSNFDLDAATGIGDVTDIEPFGRV